MNSKKNKTLRSMQNEVDQYIQQFEVGYFSPLAQMVQLTEEVGELAREIQHYYGEKLKKEELTTSNAHHPVHEELGDVLIAVIILANALDIDLTEAFSKNMHKFYTRDAHRFKRKSDIK